MIPSSARNIAGRAKRAFSAQSFREPQKALYQLSPRLHQAMVTRGVFAERKWTELPADQFEQYIADDHPDRDWFVRWFETLGPTNALEVGGGGLHEVRALRDRGALAQSNYTVADVATGFLAEGRRRLPDVTFVEGSINKLPFADNTFEVVFSRAVLEHQPYYKKPISELFRVSRGIVVLNLFRWALEHDVLERPKYYNNSYEIRSLLSFVAQLAESTEHFLVLQRDVPGENEFPDDPNVRRTGDHLVIIGSKLGAEILSPYDALNAGNINFLARPYS